MKQRKLVASPRQTALSFLNRTGTRRVYGFPRLTIGFAILWLQSPQETHSDDSKPGRSLLLPRGLVESKPLPYNQMRDVPY